MKKVYHIIIKTFKYLAIAVAIALLLSLILLGRSFTKLKLFYGHTISGKNNLEIALNLVKVRDLVGAKAAAAKAEEGFSKALNDLDEARAANKFLNNFGPAKNQIEDLAYLDRSGLILSRAFGRGLELVEPLTNIIAAASNKKFSELSEADKAKILKTIYEAEPEIAGLKAELDLAYLNLDKIPQISVLLPVYSQITTLKGQVEEARTLLASALPFIHLTPALAGYPGESRFLLLLQNTDELRPSGGFLGTYGILRLHNGEIRDLKTEDTYHLDMPVKDTLAIKPPAPLAKYLKVERWFLRDANWSPDWPTSARNIQYIYNEELNLLKQPQPGFTGVIGITPDFVADLLSITGPISVNGQMYDKNNFQSLLQYTVEVGYKDDQISSWDRKDVINALISEIKSRLFALPANRSKELVLLLSRHLDQKNILLYFNDTALQSTITDFNWAGTVKPTDGDYLMVVDANLGAFKSDAVMQKTISYSLTGKEQPAVASLNLGYRHNGGYDWRTTTYRSYTRVLVPLGSKLRSIKGEEEGTELSYDDTELNKTVFAFFFKVAPGSAQEIQLEYELPKTISNLAKTNGYSLYVQKQAGRKTESLNVQLNLGAGEKSYKDTLLVDKYFR